MGIKKTLGIVGLLAAGYGVGKIHGCVKTFKTVIDVADEALPGYKRKLADKLHEHICNEVFKEK